MNAQVKSLLQDLAERVVFTFVEAFIPLVLVTDTAATSRLALSGHTSADWRNAFFVGLLAAFFALVTTLLSWMSNLQPMRNAYVDLLYRVGMAFLQTLAAYSTAAGAISALAFDWDTALTASLAAAGQALFKGLIGLHAPTKGASVLVLDPTKLHRHPLPHAAEHAA